MQISKTRNHEFECQCWVLAMQKLTVTSDKSELLRIGRGPFKLSVTEEIREARILAFTLSVADNSDLLAVTVTSTTKVTSGQQQQQQASRQRRFLVVDIYQIVLVEPDSTRLGWGVATFVGFLQVIMI